MDADKSVDLLLVETMAKKWNFTYEFVNSGQDWGTYKNQTWTGTVRLLMDGYADVGTCAMSTTFLRHKVIDFSFYIFMDHIAFILQHPKTSTNKNILIQPFRWELWLAIWFSFIIVWILIKFITKQIYNRSIENVTMKLCAISLRQTVNFSSQQSTPIRILYMGLMIAMSVLTPYYCGSYFAILNISEYDLPIDTIENLVKALSENSVYAQTIKLSSLMDLAMNSRRGPYYWLGMNIRR